ncbi:hypothetical protein [Haloferula sargassicola]|uniref:Uncharacterized protein n=1 Tax=Haloferula sargassicola TaxID=490096 RepID=A0ABP9UPY2_9BACT
MQMLQREKSPRSWKDGTFGIPETIEEMEQASWFDVDLDARGEWWFSGSRAVSYLCSSG